MKILITGASSGIGQALLHLCLSQGYEVTAIARDFSKCTADLTLFNPIEIDLSKLNILQKQLQPIFNNKSPFDAAVLCAGQGLFGTLEQLSFAQIEHLMNINFLSQVALTKMLLPPMKANQSGTLIYLGSEAALQGKSQGTIYCATKFALRGFTQSLRKECAKSSVRICLINPGMVQTPFFDALHFSHAQEEDYYCKPEEIAQVIFAQLNARAGLVFDEVNLSPLKHQIVVKPTH